MDLFKNFTMGGLFQAGRRMAPPWGAFRRFTNTYRDPEGTFHPYGRGLEVSNAPTVSASNGASGFTHLGPLSTHFFRKGILQFHAMRSGGGAHRGVFSYLGPDGTPTTIMQPFQLAVDHNTVITTKHMTYMPSSNFSSCTVARKAYINAMVNTSDFISTKPVNGFTPEEHYLMSFDGIRLRGAGLPLPWTHIDSSGAAGAHYARVVYATIGMDAEVIFSPYMQQRLSSASRAVYFGGYSSAGVKRSDVIGATDHFPTRRGPKDHLFEEEYSGYNQFGAAGTNVRYFDKRFITQDTTTPVITAGGDLQIVAGEISSAVEVGDWLMLHLDTSAFGIYNLQNAHLYMFKVKSIAGLTVTFDKNYKYLDLDTVTWTDDDLLVRSATMIAISGAAWAQLLLQMKLSHFTNMFMIVAYSTTAASGYVVHNIFPVCWDSQAAFPAGAGVVNLASAKVFQAPWAGVVSSIMGDWYDHTTVRTTFPPLKGVTNYKELLVGFDSNALYFNDVSLGGSTEMVSGLSNLIPYGSEYGDIIAVCGSEDFLLVSRERKNYIITGDIAGTSFNITECDLAVPGAYNTKCASNAWAGQVIFANAAGIFSASSSGAIKDISADIKGLFFNANRDNNLFDKTVFKTLAQTRAAGFDGGIFKFALEDTRGFVLFLTAKASSLYAITGSNMLVYNTSEGKWYEFEGASCPSVECNYGAITALGANRAIEDGVMRGTEKQLLVTHWMTVDAPSLEKQVCQLKMFGEFVATGAGLKGMTVGQQNDWEEFDSADRSNWNTNTTYNPETHQVYFHKKRLNSSKALTTSVILESLATGSFTVEGMEIEGVLIQQGMKK